jgi:hypothetical protein
MVPLWKDRFMAREKPRQFRGICGAGFCHQVGSMVADRFDGNPQVDRDLLARLSMGD